MSLFALMKTFFHRAPRLLVALTPAMLAGCISSTAPILGDAKAILGERIDMHMYNTQDGALRSDGIARLQWNGSRYLRLARSDRVDDFTVHAFEGRDLIVQTAPRPPRPVEYALARRIANGVYLVVPIDEAVADEATRARFCTKTPEASCRVQTPEQLFVFARAMADNIEDYSASAVAVIVQGGRR